MAVSVAFEGVVPDPGVERLVTRAGQRMLRHAGLTSRELSVLITDNTVIQEMNQEWFGRNRPTNCISFPQEGIEGPLGDIVISMEQCRKEAGDTPGGTRQRLLELLAHGIAHLVGYDHERGCDAEKEQAIFESRLLKVLRKEKIMAELCVNVDHVATIRQARGGREPDPVTAATITELAGADGIVVHLREDRRHIQDRDLRLLRQVVRTRLTLEMAATDEMISIASEVRPDRVTLVPERREELTTEGGLDVIGNQERVGEAVKRINDAGIPVTLFVDPESPQIEASSRVGAQCIEIHTGRYAEAKGAEEVDREFDAIARAASIGMELGLSVHVGHGLNYQNVARLAQLPEIEEFSIGHSIISRAVFVGLDRAVRDMVALIKQGFVV